jgi:FlaA1/EpsC-like NDP-sugar epimerase
VQGLRPGEKLYEELFIRNENRPAEVHKISAANEVWLSTSQLVPFLEKLKRFADRQDSKVLKAILLELAFLDEEYKSELAASNDDRYQLPLPSNVNELNNSQFDQRNKWAS